jgi:hypothetical protein
VIGAIVEAAAGACPTGFPIKGLTVAGGRLYYRPDHPAYAAQVAEVCFVTEGGAQAAGYRRAQ